MKTCAPLLLSLLLVAPALGAAPASPVYPLLRVLTKDDALFVQQQAALDEFRGVAESHNRGDTPFPVLSLFEYTRRSTDDLFSLNARIGLRYDTLATLNGAPDKGSFDARSTILIPSQDGLFVNNPPRGWLEELILSTRLENGEQPQALVVVRDGKRLPVWYFANESFSAVERKYFLGMLFSRPLAVLRVTSGFGWRGDPFTGQREFHDGIDLAGNEGAEVMAARDGVVVETGTNATLGNYIILDHGNGLETVYGHLSAIRVIMNQRVVSGAVIGLLGHTGYATGPHLHFEVREKGTAMDPAQLLALKKD